MAITTAPHLLILRPSPTTAEFTVTTLPPQTIATRFMRLLLWLLRLALSLAAASLLFARWNQIGLPSAKPSKSFLGAVTASFSSPAAAAAPPPPSLSTVYFSHLVRGLFASYPGPLLEQATSAVPTLVVVPVCLALFGVLSLRLHRTESILVLRGLGVQTSESSATYLSGSATRFIPTEKIQDIFVNEAFRNFEVRYYLVVVVEGEEDVVVVFPGLLPRRRVVEEVWRGVRECLYEGKEDVK